MQGTYPLDTLRLRLAVDPGSRSMRGAAAALLREGSRGAFFRGLGTGLAGLPLFSAAQADQVGYRGAAATLLAGPLSTPLHELSITLRCARISTLQAMLWIGRA